MCYCAHSAPSLYSSTVEIPRHHDPMFASKIPLLLQELNKHHLSVVMRDALAFSIELKAITHHYFYSVLKLFGVIQHESD